MARVCDRSFVILMLAVLVSALPSIISAKRIEDGYERASFNSLANFIRENRNLSNKQVHNARAYDCTGKPDGNYPDYDQCSGYFYMCTNGYDKYFACALQGTVFDPTLDRCEYCQLVYPCNADPNNIRCPDGGVGPTCPDVIPPGYICVCGATSCELQLVSTTVARPTCPPYDPNVYICVCGATSCSLELIRPTCPPFDPNVYICVCGATSCQLQLISTTTARPTCPPFDPNVYICVCGSTSCNLELIKPTCPPYDPSVYICVCGATSCQLQLISTTTARPTCPPYDPNVYVCVCGSTSCNLELIKPTCPPYDPSVYICVCGVSSCQLQLITTTARPAPTCPPYDPNVYICVCGATSCNLELIKPTCPPYDPSVYICVCGVSSCNLELISTTARPTGGVTAPCPGRTVGTTPGNYQYDCKGKPDGNYEDPFDFCSGGFYMCTNGEAEYFICALQNTVFDPRQDRCDYCYNVPPCNAPPF